MITELSPVAALGLGVLGAAAALTPMILLFRKRASEAEGERLRIEAVAVKAREILGGSPDGLFIWDHVSGGITCSRALAKLLTLSDGTNSRFDAVIRRFEPEARAPLEAAVAALRDGGMGFQLVLPLLGTGKRTLIQVVGSRAISDRNSTQPEVLADMVWMRDVSQAAQLLVDLTGDTDLPEARDLHIRSLLDALPFPVWLRDEEMKVAFTNQAALSKRVAAPDQAQAEAARADGRAVTQRHDLMDAGDPVAYEVTESPLSEDGNASIIGFAFELPTAPSPPVASPSQQEQGAAAPEPEPVAQALPSTPTAASPDLAQAVLKNLPIAVAIFDDGTRLEQWNAAYVELWGLDAAWLEDHPDFGEVLEHLRAERLLPEVPDFRAYKMEQLQLFDDVKDVTGDLMHLPDGRTLKHTCHPLPDGGLAFTFEDVTDQLDLERSINALGAVQRATLDNLFEAIAVFGSDGRLKLSNPRFAELWRLTKGQLTPRTHMTEFVEAVRGLASLKGTTEQDWAKQRQRMLATLMSRKLERDRVRLSDGRVLEYANVPLPDGAALLSYLDITDDVKLEDALRARAEAFQEASRIKSEFIASLSKELRTPLNAITGFADMLAGNYFGELTPRQSEYATNIMETSRGLVEVVANILELAAIEADQIELETDEIAVSPMLQETAHLFAPQVKQKDLRLTLQLAPDLGIIRGDERRLRQAIAQLLDNAVTYTPNQGRVHLAGATDGDHVVISVSDTGPGIGARDQERIFQPFEKAPSPDRDGQGAGLGLALVRSFIHLHGGTVDIQSKENQGTRVMCRLPRTPHQPLSVAPHETPAVKLGRPLTSVGEDGRTEDDPALIP